MAETSTSSSTGPSTVAVINKPQQQKRYNGRVVIAVNRTARKNNKCSRPSDTSPLRYEKLPESVLAVADDLVKFFKGLNMDVKYRENVDQKAIGELASQLIDTLKKGTYEDHEIILFYYIGHGEKGELLPHCTCDECRDPDVRIVREFEECRDPDIKVVRESVGEPQKINDLIKKFHDRQTKDLRKIPILFFFDCCQGSQNNEGMLVTKGMGPDPKDEADEIAKYFARIPDAGNILIAHSALPMLRAYCDSEHGPHWSRVLLKNLKRYHSISDVLHVTQREVSRIFCGTNDIPNVQTSMFYSTLYCETINIHGLRVGDPLLLDPEQTFSKDVTDDAEAYIQNVYEGKMDVERLLHILTYLKKSIKKKDRDLFVCMLQRMYDEYQKTLNTKHQIPERELQIRGQLVGGIIKHGLVTYKFLWCALRYVLDSLERPLETKMYLFGVAALDKFKTRLHEFPHYCAMIHQRTFPDFHGFPKDLIQYIKFGRLASEPPSASEEPTPLPPGDSLHKSESDTAVSTMTNLESGYCGETYSDRVDGDDGSQPLASQTEPDNSHFQPSQSDRSNSALVYSGPVQQLMAFRKDVEEKTEEISKLQEEIVKLTSEAEEKEKQHECDAAEKEREFKIRLSAKEQENDDLKARLKNTEEALRKTKKKATVFKLHSVERENSLKEQLEQLRKKNEEDIEKLKEENEVAKLRLTLEHAKEKEKLKDKIHDLDLKLQQKKQEVLEEQKKIANLEVQLLKMEVEALRRVSSNRFIPAASADSETAPSLITQGVEGINLNSDTEATTCSHDGDSTTEQGFPPQPNDTLKLVL